MTVARFEIAIRSERAIILRSEPIGTMLIGGSCRFVLSKKAWRLICESYKAATASYLIQQSALHV